MSAASAHRTDDALVVALNGWFCGQPVGSGRYVDALAAALPAHGVAPRVVRPKRRGQWRKLAFEQRTFPAAARGAAVAHVPYWGPPMRSPVPLVVTVHDLIPLLRADYRRDPLVRAYTALVVHATRRAALVIADSAHGARDIVAHLGVPEARVRVVPLGVDPVFAPERSAGDGRAAGAVEATGPAAAILARSGLPPRYGLYVGGFDRRKDVGALLTAWRMVWDATGVPLAVAGRLPEPPARHAPDGPTRTPDPRAQAVAADLPPAAVRFLGAVPDADLPALYAGAAVFAFPSRDEGFGLPPLEAMASGTPVVVADAASLPEVVGEAGLRVPVGDVATLAEALIAVLAEDGALAARLRGAGLERAARFTWDATARVTAEVYREVAGDEGLTGS